MKLLFKILFCLFAFVLIQSCEDGKSRAANTAAQTQQKGNRDRSQVDHIGNIIRRLNEMVTLTPEQEEKIRNMGKQYSLVGKTREERRAIKREFRDRLEKEVLTPEQVETILAKM